MIKFIKQNVEYVPQPNEINDFIAKCGRVCYKSDKSKDSLEFVQRLAENKHFSVFRHVSIYYRIPLNCMPINSLKAMLNRYTPYLSYVENKDKNDRCVYVAANLNLLYDAPELSIKFGEYSMSFEDAVKIPLIKEYLIRYTVICTTQISTSRELNRVSPNNITEQSTRYVNYNKQGAVEVVKPYWFNFASKFLQFLIVSYLKLGSWLYNYIIKCGFKAQDAREVLTLMTATRVVYTYNIGEWKHILDLRYYGKTGKPHPNAFYIANEIRKVLVSLGHDIPEIGA